MADLVLFGKNVAAQHWRDPERWKEARGYSQSIERLWGPRSVARKIDEGVTIDPDRFKRARPTYDLVSVTPECEVHVRPRVCQSCRIETCELSPDLHELAGTRVWKRINQNGFDRREDNRGGSYAERD